VSALSQAIVSIYSEYQPCQGGSPAFSGSNSQGLSLPQVAQQALLYPSNTFDIPIPSVLDLFLEQMAAPFFVFQVRHADNSMLTIAKL
jgi:hypothetical protein